VVLDWQAGQALSPNSTACTPVVNKKPAILPAEKNPKKLAPAYCIVYTIAYTRHITAVITTTQTQGQNDD
jgi:hypothetical protein